MIKASKEKSLKFVRLVRSTNLRMMKVSGRLDFNQKIVLIYKRLSETPTACVSRVRSTASLKFT